MLRSHGFFESHLKDVDIPQQFPHVPYSKVMEQPTEASSSWGYTLVKDSLLKKSSMAYLNLSIRVRTAHQFVATFNFRTVSISFNQFQYLTTWTLHMTLCKETWHHACGSQVACKASYQVPKPILRSPSGTK